MSIRTYQVKLNGKVYEVEIEEVTASSKQQVCQEQPIEEEKSNKIDNSGEGHEIVAPLQGNMFNILVKEGQKVKKGDVIAVLEAMKMENEIVAPVDGQVSTIHVEKGQSVNLGDAILKIA